jgi:hypothetical protein
MMDPERESNERDAESSRRSLSSTESYVKGVGIVNDIYAWLLSFSIGLDLMFMAAVAEGRVSAPWVTGPFHIAMMISYLIMAFLSFVAGFGPRRLRPWAQKVEAAFGLVYLACFGATWLRDLRKELYLDAMVLALFSILWAAPMIHLWSIEATEVCSPSYKSVIDETSHIRVRARLPWVSLLAIASILVWELGMVVWHIHWLTAKP